MDDELEPLGTDNIRDLLSPLIGLTVIEVTGDDWDEVCLKYPNPNERESCIYLHLSNGETLSVRVLGGPGFSYSAAPN